MGPHRILAICFLIVITLLTGALVVSTYFSQLLGVGVPLIILVIYLSLPVLFRYSAFLQRHIIFMHNYHWSPGQNYFEPSSHEIIGGRNFYLAPEPDIKIGIWHILPKLLSTSTSTNESFESWNEHLKAKAFPIIVYFHGNMGSRATPHRVEIYKLFQEENFHTISFDYRGFADSSRATPSESGLVADGLCIYNWLKETCGNSNVPIYFWGHSLGSGVSTKLAAEICKSEEKSKFLKGLILEAPFTNMGDAVNYNISSIIYRPLPLRTWFLSSTLKQNDIAFENDKHIEDVTVPVCILHAKKDIVIPYHIGKKLHEIALSSVSRKSVFTYMKTYTGESYGSAHVNIYLEPDLMTTINKFMTSSQELS